MSPHTGKTIKEAHEAEKKGTANERQKTIVKKMVKKGRANGNASKGTHGGYIVLDDKGVKRHARLHFRGNQPRFHIYISPPLRQGSV